MNKVPYTITPTTISVLVAGKMRIIGHDHFNFGNLAVELRKPVHDLDLIQDYADVRSFVAKATFGEVVISDDKVRWRGKDVHNVVASRLLDLLRAGEDLEPLSLFLGKLMQNPVESARDELYLFLETGAMPITPEGNFIAFKKVRSDYKDVHSGTKDYSLGATVTEERSSCDTDRNNLCSRGLHFCSFGYLKEFGGTRIVMVEINPADVVAIPRDYQNTKGRTWCLKVIGEIKPDEAEKVFTRNRPVYDGGSSHPEITPAVSEGTSFKMNEVVRCLEADEDDLITVGELYVTTGDEEDDCIDVYVEENSTSFPSSLFVQAMEAVVLANGDVVELRVSHEYFSHGRAYKVIGTDRYEAGNITIRDDDGDEQDLPAGYFKKTALPYIAFEVGDVVCSLVTDKAVGAEEVGVLFVVLESWGTVVEVEACHSRAIYEVVPSSLFKLVQEAPTFEKGDKVWCWLDEDGAMTGQVYTVRDVYPDATEPVISLVGHDEFFFTGYFRKLGEVAPDGSISKEESNRQDDTEEEEEDHFEDDAEEEDDFQDDAEEEDQVEDDTDSEVQPDPTVALIFTSKDGRTFSAEEVESLLDEHGQRGASRLTGVPRTTLQEWKKLIQAGR